MIATLAFFVMLIWLFAMLKLYSAPPVSSDAVATVLVVLVVFSLVLCAFAERKWDMSDWEALQDTMQYMADAGGFGQQWRACNVYTDKLERAMCQLPMVPAFDQVDWPTKTI